MSRWKLTLEHTDDDGRVCSVSAVDSIGNEGEDDEFDQAQRRNELSYIASGLAKIICSFEILGGTIPQEGQKVLQAFVSFFNEHWRYWEELAEGEDD
jgi:hypothetical protein